MSNFSCFLENGVCHPYVYIEGHQIEDYIAQGWDVKYLGTKFKWFLATYEYEAGGKEIIKELIHLSKCITAYTGAPENKEVHILIRLMTKELRILYDKL